LPTRRRAANWPGLPDPHARDAFFNDALDGATKALVLTEGLLMYLEDRDVVALSDATKRPEVSWWMLEVAFPGLKKMMNKKMAGMLQNAPFKFAPDNGLAYFEDLGWRAVEVESLTTDQLEETSPRERGHETLSHCSSATSGMQW
jgi:O-methyltransferase involved in polyketide biosynthesis